MADEQMQAPGGAEPAPEVEQPDLEAIRDERTIPVAREIIKIMAEGTGTDDQNAFTQSLVEMLKASLAADLNLTTENPYMFQLALGVFAAFQVVAQRAEMAESQNPRYAKIGHEMMQMLVSANVPMGKDVKPDEQEKALEVIKPQLEALYLRENLSSLEVGHILEGVFKAFQTLEQGFSGNIDRAVKILEAKILQIDDMSDLTMKKLDAVMQADIKDILAAADVTRETVVETPEKV